MQLTDFLTPLGKNTFWVEAPGKGRYPFSNGFLITGKETILIDAGIGEERIREIDAVHRIDSLIISHSHLDHLLHWPRLNDRRILIPRETPDGFTDLMELGIRFTGSRELAIPWIKRVTETLDYRPLREPDGRYHHNEIIDNGTVKIEAIHAPGHLSDHYCFFIHGDDVLLSTDIDFESFGPWYGNPESDIETFRESIRMIRKLPYTRVCGSHKPPLKQEEAPKAFDRYLELFDERQNSIYDLCAEPRSLQELISASPFYRDKMPNKTLQDIFEKQMINKNIDILLRENRIEQTGERFQQTGR